MQDRRRGRKVAHVREVECAAQPQVPLAHTREQHWASLLHLDRFLVLFGLHAVSAAAGGGRSQRGPQQAGEQPSSVGSPADTLYDPVKPLGLHGSHLPACARLLRRWRLGQRGAVAIVNGEMVSLMDPLYTRQSPPGGCGDCNTVLTERRNASSSEVRS